jgi:multidrug efflux pump
LCATIIKPSMRGNELHLPPLQPLFDWSRNTYTGHIRGAIRHMPTWMGAFDCRPRRCARVLFAKLPTSFVPEEDQGYALAIGRCRRRDASRARTRSWTRSPRSSAKSPEVEGVFAISGFSFVGSGENVGMAFIRLKPMGASAAHTGAAADPAVPGVSCSAASATGMAFVVNLPTIRGLGRFGGFDMYLEDRAGQGHAALIAAQNMLLGKAAQRADTLVGVRPNGLEDSPQLQMIVDRVQAQSTGPVRSLTFTTQSA